MDVTKDILHDKRPDLKDPVQRQWTQLTDEDMARLNSKREELNVVLRQWQRYSRMQADRVISSWLYNRGQGCSSRTWQIPPKRTPKLLTRFDA